MHPNSKGATKMKKLLAILTLTTILLTACSSYSDFENKLKSDVKDAVNGEPQGTAEPAQPRETAPVAIEKSDGTIKENLQIGDVVNWDLSVFDPINPAKSEFIIDKVNIYNSINDLGLKKEDFNSLFRDRINDNGTLIDGFSFIEMDMTFLDFTKDSDGNSYISDFYLAYLPEVGSSDDIPIEPGFIEKAYFSNPVDTQQKYYAFKFTGEGMKAKVGWIINTDVYNIEHIWFRIGSAGDPEHTRSTATKYVQLNLKK
jgi:hypothetical protein